jgi:hypothetical protein
MNRELSLAGGGRRGSDPPGLELSVRDAGVLEHAATPTMAFELEIQAGDARIESLALNADIRIEAAARDYETRQVSRLAELFGQPTNRPWTMGTLFWTHVSTVIPSFTGWTRATLTVPCTYDFEVVWTKYLHAVDRGDIPLLLLFSGTIFYADESHALRAARIPWDREARLRLPAAVWHAMMEHYYPNTAWVRLRRDVFDRLNDARIGLGLASWEAVIEVVLAGLPPSAGVAPSPPEGAPA